MERPTAYYGVETPEERRIRRTTTTTAPARGEDDYESPIRGARRGGAGSVSSSSQSGGGSRNHRRRARPTTTTTTRNRNTGSPTVIITTTDEEEDYQHQHQYQHHNNEYGSNQSLSSSVVEESLEDQSYTDMNHATHIIKDIIRPRTDTNNQDATIPILTTASTISTKNSFLHNNNTHHHYNHHPSTEERPNNPTLVIPSPVLSQTSVGTTTHSTNSFPKAKQQHSYNTKISSVETSTSNHQKRILLHPMEFQIPSHAVTLILGPSSYSTKTTTTTTAKDPRYYSSMNHTTSHEFDCKTILLNVLSNSLPNQVKAYAKVTFNNIHAKDSNKNENDSSSKDTKTMTSSIIPKQTNCDNFLYGFYTCRSYLQHYARLVPTQSTTTTTTTNIHKRIDAILDSLDLLHQSNTIIGDNIFYTGLNDGQKRRFAIALETITCPNNLFLEEPCNGTGVDDKSTLLIMKYLQNYVRGNSSHSSSSSSQQQPQTTTQQERRVIFTMNTNESSSNKNNIIWNFVDHVLLLSNDGKLIYAGPKNQMEDFFKFCHHPTPYGWNCMDHYVSTVNFLKHSANNEEEDAMEQELFRYTRHHQEEEEEESNNPYFDPPYRNNNGDNTKVKQTRLITAEEWRNKFMEWKNKYGSSSSSSSTRANNQGPPRKLKNARKLKNNNNPTEEEKQQEEHFVDEEGDDDAFIVNNKTKQQKQQKHHHKHHHYLYREQQRKRSSSSNPIFVLVELTYRYILNLWFHPCMLLTRGMLYGLSSFIIGLLFWGLGEDNDDNTNPYSIHSRTSIGFVSTTVFIFMSVITIIPFTITEQHTIVNKEIKKNNYYHPIIYQMAQIFTSIVNCLLLSCLITFIIVPLTKLNHTLWYYITIFISLFLSEALAQLICYLVVIVVEQIVTYIHLPLQKALSSSSAITVDTYISMVILSAIYMYFLLIQGFLLLPSEIPFVLSWTNSISFHTYLWRIFMVTQFFSDNLQQDNDNDDAFSSSTMITNQGEEEEVFQHQSAVTNGERLLQFYEIEDVNRETDIILLGCYALVLHLISILVLHLNYYAFYKGDIVHPNVAPPPPPEAMTVANTQTTGSPTTVATRQRGSGNHHFHDDNSSISSGSSNSSRTYSHDGGDNANGSEESYRQQRKKERTRLLIGLGIMFLIVGGTVAATLIGRVSSTQGKDNSDDDSSDSIDPALNVEGFNPLFPVVGGNFFGGTSSSSSSSSSGGGFFGIENSEKDDRETDPSSTSGILFGNPDESNSASNNNDKDEPGGFKIFGGALEQLINNQTASEQANGQRGGATLKNGGT